MNEIKVNGQLIKIGDMVCVTEGEDLGLKGKLFKIYSNDGKVTATIQYDTKTFAMYDAAIIELA